MKTSRRPKRAAAAKAAKAVTKGKTRRQAPKPEPAGRAGRKMAGRRADFGAPIGGYFAKQPLHLRAILEALRELVEDAAPEATASLKWGVPFYSIGREMMCALGGHKSHVNLILPGPTGTFVDPDGLLEGEAKTGRHLKLRTLDDLPRQAVRGWLRTAAQRARGNAARR